MANINSKYRRNGFGLKELIQPDLSRDYESNLIQLLRSNNNSMSRSGITIRLAKAFGFCWGIDRAVAMVYETRQQFPNSRIWITSELTHNPFINDNLQLMHIDLIPLLENGSKDLSVVSEHDVVILPAFGAPAEEMNILLEKSCHIIDTTCPWVSRVWNRVVDEHVKARTFAAGILA